MSMRTFFRSDSMWLLFGAAAVPVVLVALALFCYVYAKCRILADAMILLAIPCVAGSVFFAGHCVFRLFLSGRRGRAFMAGVVYIVSLAVASFGTVRLLVSGLF